MTIIDPRRSLHDWREQAEILEDSIKALLHGQPPRLAFAILNAVILDVLAKVIEHQGHPEAVNLSTAFVKTLYDALGGPAMPLPPVGEPPPLPKPEKKRKRKREAH